ASPSATRHPPHHSQELAGGGMESAAPSECYSRGLWKRQPHKKWPNNESDTTHHPSPARVARFAHARDGGPDLVAQQRVEIVADRAKLAGEHEIGRARMRMRHVDRGLDAAGPRGHDDNAIGQEHRLSQR